MNQSERFVYDWLQQEGYLPSEISRVTSPLSVFVTEDGKTWFPRRLYGEGILLYRTQVDAVVSRPDMQVVVTDGHRVTHTFPASMIDRETLQVDGGFPTLPIKVVDLPGGQLVRISDASAAYLAEHNLTADTVIRKYAEGVRATTIAVSLDEDAKRAIQAEINRVRDEILQDCGGRASPRYTVHPDPVSQPSQTSSDPQRQGNKERFPIL